MRLLLTYLFLIFSVIMHCQVFVNLAYYEKNKPNFKKSIEKEYDLNQKLTAKTSTIFRLHKYSLRARKFTGVKRKRKFIARYSKNLMVEKYKYNHKPTVITRYVSSNDSIKGYRHKKLIYYTVTIKDTAKTIQYNEGNVKAKSVSLIVNSVKSVFDYNNGKLTGKTIYFFKPGHENPDSCQHYNEGSELDVKYFFTYDDNDNLILERTVLPFEKYPDRYRTVIEYIYDDKKNWIEKKTTLEKVEEIIHPDSTITYTDKVYITKRKIIYK